MRRTVLTAAPEPRRRLLPALALAGAAAAAVLIALVVLKPGPAEAPAPRIAAVASQPVSPESLAAGRSRLRAAANGHAPRAKRMTAHRRHRTASRPGGDHRPGIPEALRDSEEHRDAADPVLDARGDPDHLDSQLGNRLPVKGDVDHEKLPSSVSILLLALRPALRQPPGGEKQPEAPEALPRHRRPSVTRSSFMDLHAAEVLAWDQCAQKERCRVATTDDHGGR